MIIGIGIDLIETDRIAGILERHRAAFSRRILTVAELVLAESWHHAATFYAGRWAAKESVSKVLGTGIGRKCRWRDIEILNDTVGKPFIVLTGAARETADALAIDHMIVSITHEKSIAAAVVVGEGSSRS